MTAPRGLYRTLQAVAVARVLLEEPQDPQGHYGLNIAVRAEVSQPVALSVLQRFQRHEWLTNAGYGRSPLGGSPRRYYQVTELGRQKMQEFVNGEK